MLGGSLSFRQDRRPISQYIKGVEDVLAADAVWLLLCSPNLIYGDAAQCASSNLPIVLAFTKWAPYQV
jgi:hypothetical protein